MLRLALALLLAYPCLSDEDLLDAIAEVETGTDHSAVGRKGERGAWQFREGGCTWCGSEGSSVGMYG